jgi:carboxymethylenebutenolidase
VASIVKIRVGDGTMDMYLGVPVREAEGPAIVLMYHRGGIDAFTKAVVERLADSGYLVAVPDVYHRCPGAMPLSERKSLLRDSEIVSDVQATIDALRSRADVAADRIVVMGHCMGGRMALLAAGQPARLLRSRRLLWGQRHALMGQCRSHAVRRLGQHTLSRHRILRR